MCDLTQHSAHLRHVHQELHLSGGHQDEVEEVEHEVAAHYSHRNEDLGPLGLDDVSLLESDGEVDEGAHGGHQGQEVGEEDGVEPAIPGSGLHLPADKHTALLGEASPDPEHWTQHQHHLEQQQSQHQAGEVAPSQKLELGGLEIHCDHVVIQHRDGGGDLKQTHHNINCQGWM